MLINGSPLAALDVPEVDAATPLSYGSQSTSPTLASTGTRTDRQMAKRRAASEWISLAIGEKVPYETDQAFRAALADGVTLCRLINWVRPGIIPKVVEGPALETSSHSTGEVIQTFENVTNYIRAAQSLVGETISACDLERSAEERPAVAESILSLRDVAAGRSPKPLSVPGRSPREGSTPGGGTPNSIFSMLPPGTRRASASLATPPLLSGATSFPPPSLRRSPAAPAAPGFSFTPAAAELPPAPAPAAAAPPFALDAVGPVLENVLSNLTSEYEKRLLSKDQEFKLAQEAQERMRRQIGRIQAEMEGWRAQAEALLVEKRAEEEAREGQGMAGLEEGARSSPGRQSSSPRSPALDLQSRLDLEAATARAAEAEARAEELRELLAAEEGARARGRGRGAGAGGGAAGAGGKVRARLAPEPGALQRGAGRQGRAARVLPGSAGRATGDAAASVVEPGPEAGALRVWSAKHRKWHGFRFDAVFGPQAAQPDVYAETAPLVRSVLDGFNVCVFAYGQTGSGKTHTMQGGGRGGAGDDRGVNYRTLEDLFALRDERRGEAEYAFRVQLLEIYNEQLRDLLVDGKGSGGIGGGGSNPTSNSLSISATAPSGFNVPDAQQIEVRCAEDVLEVMALGSRNRAVAETRMNERSSRSHLVLTVIVEGRGVASEEQKSALNHARRVGRSGAEGRQLLEAQHINRSLSALGGVLQALAAKAPHVPFRDSKLTQLLQDSLSGGAKTMMFVHVAPEESSVSETLSTLNFGKAVTEITLGAAKRNVVVADGGGAAADRDALAQELEAERAKVRRLEAELASVQSQDHGSIPAAAPLGASPAVRRRLSGASPVSRLPLGKLAAGGVAGGGEPHWGRPLPGRHGPKRAALALCNDERVC
ncbi:hypothetical protein QBZ16_005442 [Prototheca wickerhamii]|uniref:Kinesin-like protein n=1 Tax=Prototheca wickerhamii TaxID=3111 RepID=A0AAD9MHE2_PROWI|nr:hypothetical protein QBZ16_005442 [Prototheca wickerhamii]